MIIKKEFIIETTTNHGMTQLGRCYSPKNLANNGYKNEHQKMSILKEKLKSFKGEWNQMSILLLSIWRRA